jgi:hypothetical protein
MPVLSKAVKNAGAELYGVAMKKQTSNTRV